MDEREALARLIAEELGDGYDNAFASKSEWIGARGKKGGRDRDVNEPRQTDYDAAADRILAAGYRLPTTGELAAERRGWEAAAEALDHWGDQEDAAAITCPEADVTVHREREAAFYDAAARLRAAPRATAALGGRDNG